MRLTYGNGAALAAAGMFVFLGATSASAQASNPNQNGGFPNGNSNAAQNYPGQGNLNSGNPNTRTGTAMEETGDGPSGMGRAGDVRFAKGAAIGGMAEVALGKLATEKSSNDKVKQFGQRMVDDHGKAGEQLKAIAAKSKITLPTELDSKHKAMVDKFSAMSGDQFDQAYVKAMVKDHEQDIVEFHQEANNGSNADLRNWAGKTLPTLQEHERMIKEIKSGMPSKISQK